MDAVGALRNLIHTSFASQSFHGPVTSGCDCDECTEIARCLRGKSWLAIDDGAMDVLFGSLPLLSDAAWSAFVPAWLVHSLDSLHANEQKVREWTLYDLALYLDEEDEPEDRARTTDRLRSRYRGLTPGQIAVVEQWLRLMHDHAPVTDWDRESIDRTLQILREL